MYEETFELTEEERGQRFIDLYFPDHDKEHRVFVKRDTKRLHVPYIKSATRPRRA